MKIFAFLVLFFLIVRPGYSLDHLATRQLANSIQSFTTVQKPKAYCASRNDSVCPQIISQLIQDDKENSFVGLLKSRYPTCKKYVEADANNKFFSSARDLASQLSTNQASHLGSMIGADVLRCAGSESDFSKEAISKYYYYYSRLSQAQSDQLESIASIDLVLGDKPLSGISCADISLRQGQQQCQKIQSECQPQQGLQEITTKSQKAKAEIAELENQKAIINKEYGSRGLKGMHSEKGKKLEAQMQALDFMIETIKSQNTWLNGETYKKAIKSGLSETEAISLQLKKNRAELKKLYQDGQQVQACLAGQKSTQCTADRVREYVDKAPTPPGLESVRGDSTQARKQSSVASGYLAMQACLHEGTMDRRSTAKTLAGAVMDAGLTGVSLGLGWLYTAPKALVSARALAVSRFAKTADQAFNAGYFAGSLKTAAEACLTEKNVIAATSESNKQCSVKNVLQGAQATSVYDGCVSTAMWAGLDGLPFASGFLQKAAQARGLAGTAAANNLKASQAALLVETGAEQKNILRVVGTLDDTVDGGRARLALSERVLGRTLDAQESAWVLKAHNTHSDKTYRVSQGRSADELSTSDLKDKLKDRPASLSAAESRKLVESGILGSSTVSKSDEALRLKANKLLIDGMEKKNSTQLEEGYRSGREYYLKLAAKPESLPADWRGAQEVMEANSKGLTTKESANLFDKFLTTNNAEASSNYRSMVGQLSDEIQRLENLKSQDANWKNYQIWRAKELRYELLERYYTRKYADKYKELDLEKMADRELRLYQNAGQDLEKSRQEAKKLKWPGVN